MNYVTSNYLSLKYQRFFLYENFKFLLKTYLFCSEFVPPRPIGPVPKPFSEKSKSPVLSSSSSSSASASSPAPSAIHSFPSSSSIYYEYKEQQERKPNLIISLQHIYLKIKRYNYEKILQLVGYIFTFFIYNILQQKRYSLAAIQK